MTERVVRRFHSPLRTSALAVASGVASIVGPATAALASTPPEPPPTTMAVVYADGIATAPDRSFTAAFASAPTYTPSVDGQPERFHANADEDSQEISRFGLDSFGASAETSPTERAELFIAASGTGVEWLANTPTRLGPDPAAHFIARLTLGDGRAAAVYGLVVATAGRATYVFATDLGADDPDRSRDFVASYTSLLPPPTPVAPPTTTTTTTSVPTTVAAAPTTSGEPAATTSVPPSTTPGSTTVAPSVTATPTTSVDPVPVGAVTSPDRAWWVTFPDDAGIVATASTDDGFAYLEYRAVVSGDRLTVRAIEIPAGYEWDESTVPGFPTAAVDGEPTTIGTTPAVASTFDHEGSPVTAVVANTGTRLIAVTYLDDGSDDDAAAADFVDSLGLTG